MSKEAITLPCDKCGGDEETGHQSFCTYAPGLNLYECKLGTMVDEDRTVPEDIEECQACGFDQAPLRSYRVQWPINSKERKYLCNLCANTHAGTAVDFPSQFPEKNVIFAINYGINMILKAIKS